MLKQITSEYQQVIFNLPGSSPRTRAVAAEGIEISFVKGGYPGA
ncbi:MAG TPA: hypothetical protein VK821_10370 [Dehalococcoidia bacterium]|nr:hypothetical protein [Dehalococcoidia bacterium]